MRPGTGRPQRSPRLTRNSFVTTGKPDRLIIGGASGIGRATAAACVAEGDTVILPGRSETDAAKIGAVGAVPIDVTDEASDTGLLSDIDILVNSAGIPPRRCWSRWISRPGRPRSRST